MPTNTEHAQSLDLEELGLEELVALAGEPIDKASKEHLNYFTRHVELVKLNDLTVPNCKIILKNTFERYGNCPLVEVERNNYSTTNKTSSWRLMKRSPFVFRDVLTTPQDSFALVFDSEKSSAFKNIPSSSYFGVISEGAYFASEREFRGMVLHCELFYVPLISQWSHP